MTTPVTFTKLLSSDHTPLTKTFTLINQELTKDNYPQVANFTSEAVEIKDLSALYKMLRGMELHECLLKGNTKQPLFDQSRAGSTNPNTPTSWGVFDVDGLEIVNNSQQFMDLIGWGDVSHIEQLSSSAGIDEARGYSAHIFFLLNEPVMPSVLKLWLTDLNLTIPELLNEVKLNKVSTALRWPLDITVGQNDKLIYTAPPVCVGFDAPKITRLTLHKRNKPRGVLSTPASVTSIKTKERTLVNKLRKAAGLPRKTYSIRDNLLTNPDQGEVTGFKNDRGFVYINLNGGDSWGYYFPEDNPEILYNFKGEPNVRLKDIAPEVYHAYLDKLSPPEPSSEGTRYDIGLDVETDKYYRIALDQDTGVSRITTTGARINAFDFLKQHGQSVPDFIPTWTSYCDFTSDKTVDFENRILNRYQPTKYLRSATKSKSYEVPETISRVVHHVLGDDPEVVEHFLNWLAVIFQYKQQTLTAWVIGGTQGTGKGLLFDRVLTPILGGAHCGKSTLPAFEAEYNGFLKDRLLLFVDEVQVGELRKRSVAMAKLKEYIASPRVAIREMRANSVEFDVFCNFILASNHYDAIEIDAHDRRFNVGPRQETPLKKVMDISGIEKKIAAELQYFTDYLMSRTADVDLAMKIIETEERARLQATTENTTMAIANKIREGDFDFFVEQYTSSTDRQLEFEVASRISNAPTFKQVLKHMFDCKGTECKMPRDYLALLFYYTTDFSKPTPHGVTKFLGYHGFDMKPMHFNGATVRGATIPVVNVVDEAAWLKVAGPDLKEVKNG